MSGCTLEELTGLESWLHLLIQGVHTQDSTKHDLPILTIFPQLAKYHTTTQVGVHVSQLMSLLYFYGVNQYQQRTDRLSYKHLLRRLISLFFQPNSPIASPPHPPS